MSVHKKEGRSSSSEEEYLAGSDARAKNKKKRNVKKKQNTRKEPMKHHGEENNELVQTGRPSKNRDGKKKTQNPCNTSVNQLRSLVLLYFKSIGYIKGPIIKEKIRKDLIKEQQRRIPFEIPEIAWSEEIMWDREKQQQKYEDILTKFKQKYFQKNLDFPNKEFFLKISGIFSEEQTEEVYHLLFELCIIASNYSEEQQKEQIQKLCNFVMESYKIFEDQSQPKQQQPFIKYRYWFFNRKFTKRPIFNDNEKNKVQESKMRDFFQKAVIQIKIYKKEQLSRQRPQSESSQSKKKPLRTLKKNKNLKVIGMMSGTSQDGIDLSFCEYYQQFNQQVTDKKWRFKLLAAKTYEYSEKELQILQMIANPDISHRQYHIMELQYSEYVALCINRFITEEIQGKKELIDFISLHGHTVFHQPEQHVTIQATNLSYIAGKLCMDVVGNFRQLDVYRGGNGAPLAPYGEELFQPLQNNYQQEKMIFLNLGGIANIGYKIMKGEKKISVGTDIGYCNIVLNKFANCLDNKSYDNQGQLGNQGELSLEYYEKLKEIFSSFNFPFSLAKEDLSSFLAEIQKLCKNSRKDAQDMLRSFYEYIGDQVSDCISWILSNRNIQIQKNCPIKIFCTGGGVYNNFLMTIIKEKIETLSEKWQLSIQLNIPDQKTISFKEAIIFGLLGVKHFNNELNCQRGVGGMFVKGRKQSLLDNMTEMEFKPVYINNQEIVVDHGNMIPTIQHEVYECSQIIKRNQNNQQKQSMMDEEKNECTVKEDHQKESQYRHFIELDFDNW